MFRAKNRKRRSPIRYEEAALPLPGRSCRWMLIDEMNDFMARLAATMAMAGFGIGVGFGAAFGAKWIGYLGWGVLLIGGLLAVWYFRRIKTRVENIQLGQEGEIYVAQLLETLRGEFASKQCMVFHDLPGHADPKAKAEKRWNIDHVAVGPTGIYVIETKTWRKWEDRGKDQKLQYDGKQLTFNARKEVPQSEQVLRQTDRAAERVRAILKDTTGRHFDVRPVLVFPGWWVESGTGGNRQSDSRWVTNPKALIKWITNAPATLASEDVALVIDRLTQHARLHRDD